MLPEARIFKQEFARAQKLMGSKSVKTLKKDNPIRWGSTKVMCDVYVEQSTAVAVNRLNPNNINKSIVQFLILFLQTVADNLNLTIVFPTREEVAEVKLVQPVLKTFDQVTTLIIEQENVTASEVNIRPKT